MASKNWLSPRSLLVLAGLVLLGLLVWRFSSIVAYILIASVLALISRPLVHLMGRIRIGKWQIPISIRALITLLIIWVVFFSFFRIFIPLVANEAQELSNIDTALVLEAFEKPVQNLEVWYDKMNWGAWALFAISFITFFLLREDKLITGYIITIIPENKVEAFRHALESIKHLLRRYFVGILLQMTGILTLVTLGMTIVGVGFRLGLVIGLVAAVLNIIPYLGPWIGAIVGIILGVATHLDLDFATQLLPLIGYITLVFAITQLTDNKI